MAFTPPPPIPQRGARSSFSKAVDAFLRWVAALPAQLDVFLARLETIAAGGAYSFPYKWGVSINGSLGFPAGGFAAFDDGKNATNATWVALDSRDASGRAMVSIFTSMVAGNTSGIKGHIKLTKVGDPSKWALFGVTAYLEHNEYWVHFAVTPVASSSATPFATNDTIIVSYDKNGDKGDVGNALKKVQVAPAPVNGIVTVDYNNGACLVWTPAAGTSTLRIDNWPAAGTLGEFVIEGTNMGESGKTVNINNAINWVRPDGTFANSTSITTNHGAALRPTGVDYVLLWGRGGVPGAGKVVR